MWGGESDGILVVLKKLLLALLISYPLVGSSSPRSVFNFIVKTGEQEVKAYTAAND